MPITPISIPPMTGPMIRALLNEAELSATADCNCSRVTIAGTSESRAGQSNAEAAPASVVMTRMWLTVR